ncbi:MAG: putative TPR repeat methyltransferase [Gammaproteobacteria bacterium]|jgi:predicted TPR repeat methyltransferase
MTAPEIKVDQYDDRLSSIYSKSDNKEQQYDEWADSYDKDLVEDLEYVAHREAGKLLIEQLADRSAHILDVACGTGLVGAFLQAQGYQCVDGVDFSSAMLARAKSRQVYQSIWQHDFTNPAEVENLYDALICVGMFSFTIPKIADMHHVVNCVKPGGYCVITVNGAAWKQLDLEPEVRKVANQHKFTIQSIQTADYIRRESIDSRVLIIRR